MMNFNVLLKLYHKDFWQWHSLHSTYNSNTADMQRPQCYASLNTQNSTNCDRIIKF